MTDNAQERFPIVDEEGHTLGSITRGEAHSGTHVLHPVVHLHLFNSQGELYLQRRPLWKDIQPGRWDTACGGHIAYGETPEEALKREVFEELGIRDFEPVALGHYVFESKRESELVYVNKAVYDGQVYPSQEELDGGRFWSRQEIADAIGKGVFTPNFEHEYQQFFGKTTL
jgi:isopentenyldiphosphate isomerase